MPCNLLPKKIYTFADYERLPEGAPDLVIEILSPSTGYYDLTHKKSIYESSGVKEYWIINPDQKHVEVFALREGQFKQSGRWQYEGNAKSGLLTGFEIELITLFKPIGAPYDSPYTKNI